MSCFTYKSSSFADAVAAAVVVAGEVTTSAGPIGPRVVVTVLVVVVSVLVGVVIVLIVDVIILVAVDIILDAVVIVVDAGLEQRRYASTSDKS